MAGASASIGTPVHGEGASHRRRTARERSGAYGSCLPTTAPSKRIEALVPGYQKPVMGTLAAQEIGLQTMREACPHFGQWIARLERLPVEMEI